MRELDFGNIPAHMHDGLKNYIERGIPTGTFLRLCIINDYHAAAAAADHMNQQHLFDYINFFYNEVPAIAHGSQEAYDAWVKIGGLKGKEVLAHG